MATMMKVLFGLVALLALTVASASAKAMEVGDKDFDSKVLGSTKNSFVKFLAPWCGHCKAMKPDWDKLGSAYKNSEAVQIVDVDCTADGQGTCQKVGVKGYPTIKYYMAGDKSGKDYQGGRDFDSLKSFAESKLNKEMCNAKTKKGCAKNEIEFIEKHEGKSVEELDDLLQSKDAEAKLIKKERSDAKKEMSEKEKGWKKKEKAIQKAQAILKQMKKK